MKTIKRTVIIGWPEHVKAFELKGRSVAEIKQKALNIAGAKFQGWCETRPAKVAELLKQEEED